MSSFKTFRWLRLLFIIMSLVCTSTEFAKADLLPQLDTTLPHSTIQRIRDRDNVLIAGVLQDFPPFGFEDSHGDPVGFDVDLIRSMADIWGVKVEFLNLTSDARIPLLAAGEVDIIAAAMTHTQYREETIDFSQTYFVDGQSVLVRANSGINELSDLQDKRIAAIWGTTSIDQIKTYAIANGIRIEIVPFTDHLPALEALETGTIDALTTDRTALTQFASDNSSFQVIGESFTYEPYGLGVRTDDSIFRHLIDATLQQLKVNGKYDEIYNHWFADTVPYSIKITEDTWKYNYSNSPGTLEIPNQSMMEKVQRQQKIIVGVSIDHSPFSSLDEMGQCCIGFEIDLLREFAKRWLDDEKKITFIPIKDMDVVAQLQLGKVNLIAVSIKNTWQFEDLADLSQIYFSDERFADESYVLALPTNDSDFRDLVNLTLQEMVRDESYKHLYTKWFSTDSPYPDEIWPGMPTDPIILSMIQKDAKSRATSSILPRILNVLDFTPTMSMSADFTSVPTITNEISKSVTPTITQLPSVMLPEQPVFDITDAPTDFPPTGMSLRSYSSLPIVVLIIVTLFSGAIYHKKLGREKIT